MSCYQDNPLITPEAFQELIQERTDEKKKKKQEKRRDGLRRIAEMKSKSGVHPLNLFPKEIWLQILNDGCPEDKWNVSQVHPLFQSLMESSRIQDILFPQAIKLVLDYVKKKDDLWNRRRGISSSKLIPFLELRQVCKSVKHAVDLWFDDKYEEYLSDSLANPDPDIKEIPRRIFDFCLHYDLIPRLIENYNIATTPIPAKTLNVNVRSIKVRITPTHGYLRDMQGDVRDLFTFFKSGIVKLLGLVGNQILCFKLKVIELDWLHDVGEITVADYYLLLQECCELMPNLRRLDISLDARSDVNKVPRNLENLIQANPFPTLSQLVRIGWEQGSWEIFGVTKIIDAIFMENRQVRMLKMDIEGYLLERLNQNHLKALSLDGISWHDSGISSQVHPTILNSHQWPLTDLHLHTEIFPSLKDLFKFLMRFPTLQKVWMLASVEGIGREFLNLPNLTAFGIRFFGDTDYEMDDFNFLYSLHFLVYSKKLKSIDWDCSHLGNKEGKLLKECLEEHECPEKMIDFRGGMRDLNFSNIWNVFPVLETVEVTVPKYHNEECQYEYGDLHKFYHRPCKMLL